MANQERTAAASEKKGGALDLSTVSGLVLALAGILGGLLLEGGALNDILQITAALIVLGGTIGAVMVSTPTAVAKRALGRLAGVFHDPAPPMDTVLEEIIGYAVQARKNGLVSLEEAAESIRDPFLKKGLTLAVDGSDLREIRDMLVLEIELEEGRAEAEAKVFECAGGYAPTIGIIGAVLGLIQVMKNLADIDQVGHGIAVAFVATVYGVGLANLFLLPVSQKIKARARTEVRRKELMTEGIAGIVEGLNPKLLRAKLEAYVSDVPPKATAKAKSPSPATAPAAERN
jgi:chemotaxis protein MotA